MFANLATALPLNLRRVGGVALACSVLALSACGGGDRVKEYRPASIVSFGDDSSAFTTAEADLGDGSGKGVITGLTHTVNPVSLGSVTFCTDVTPGTLCATPQDGVSAFTVTTADGAPKYFSAVNKDDVFNVVTSIDIGTGDYPGASGAALKRTVDQFYNCAANTIWAQQVAHGLGKGYDADCQGDRSGAVSYAKAGAKVADFRAQIDAAKAAGQLREGVLVTVWLGQNDLIEIFEGTSTDKQAEAATRAATLIAGVKEILATNAKVVLVNAPNLAYSPWARSFGEQSCADVSERPCNREMDDLVVAFNKQLISSLGTDYALDGRRLGYVDAAQLSNSYARSTSYRNDQVCVGDTVAKPLECNTQNLKAGADLYGNLWADDRRIGLTLHKVIADVALTRVTEQF